MFFDVKKLAVTRPRFTTKPPQLHHVFTTTFTTQIAKYPSKTAYFLVTKYLAKFITVVQIFFLGSLFFVVAALSRRIFIVYLQGVGLFMIYIIGLTVFSATRSMERFWSGIFDPIGLVLSDDVTRYWTVVEKNSLLFSWRFWEKDGRHFYEYDMGRTPILDFYAYLSGRYATRQEQYKGVNLEVYYTPGHEFDIDDMLASSKAGLDYYQANFSPYQFAQYRIMEFPRYRQFAQSFPNTVPYSEGIGFIGRVVKKTDLDLTYFVTAHELGHQWWAHQLLGGQVQGSNMMSETLAEYSALKVVEKKYGPDYMHRALKRELDGYLRGRSGEVRHEPPLALVQREPYVWYQKGGLIMYTIADYIGEDKLSLALHNFLMRYRYANASNSETEPYPDTRLLVAAIREQTPPELQYLITDGFESIVLYDNKALTATATETPDKKYKVTLNVQARKVKADGNGNESPMALNDYIEIGVFTGKKDEEKPLYLKKEKLTQEKQTFEIVVDQMPTRAGIDPYNKLVDRISDDNMIDVTKQ